MPRKSKNLYMKYSKENSENAVKSVKDGVYSYRKASQVFGVPKTTIIDHVSGRIELTSKPGGKPVIPLEIENAVAQKVVEAPNMGFGITKKQISKYQDCAKHKEYLLLLRGGYQEMTSGVVLRIAILKWSLGNQRNTAHRVAGCLIELS